MQYKLHSSGRLLHISCLFWAMVQNKYLPTHFYVAYLLCTDRKRKWNFNYIVLMYRSKNYRSLRFMCKWFNKLSLILIKLVVKLNFSDFPLIFSFLSPITQLSIIIYWYVPDIFGNIAWTFNESVCDHAQFKNKCTFLQLHHWFIFNLQRKNKQLEFRARIYQYIQIVYWQMPCL
jgi:hypothetical protein